MSISKLGNVLVAYIRPRSDNEDAARRELILNIFIAGVLLLLLVGVVIDGFHYFFAHPDSYRENSLPSSGLYGLVGLVLGLYAFSRRGYSLISAYVLIAVMMGLTAYIGWVWGIDVPAQIILYPLTVVMAGVLISTRVAFLATLLIVCIMIGTGVLHKMGIHHPNQYWKTEVWTWTDMTMIAVIYVIVAVAAWLSNREIEKALSRARRSEKELMRERDLLEHRVRERTDEVRRLQMERMAGTYRLVEFGRFAGSIFHDLFSPLAALSLTVSHLAESKETEAHAEDIARAKRAIGHMHERLEAMRTYLRSQRTSERFSLGDAISGVVEVLTPYATERGVRINVEALQDVSTVGDQVAFVQVITNLISNAIQAYMPSGSLMHEVRVVLALRNGTAEVSVMDTGAGIASDALAKIFEPFFTTKPSSEGLGIGLSLAKRIIEKEFGGTITVDSVLGHGSTFTVYLPIREP